MPLTEASTNFQIMQGVTGGARLAVNGNVKLRRYDGTRSLGQSGDQSSRDLCDDYPYKWRNDGELERKHERIRGKVRLGAEGQGRRECRRFAHDQRRVWSSD